MLRLSSVGRVTGFSLALVVLLGTSSARAAPTDPLTQMFEWWNKELVSPAGLSEDGMRKHLSNDAVLIIDGRELAHGLDAWMKHFKKIGAAKRKVEIVLPFRHMFRSGNKIYTYHVIRSRDKGVAQCMLAAGHAFLDRKGKITEVSLVRTTLDAQSAAKDPDCYKD